jgi:hypothetical protein
MVQCKDCRKSEVGKDGRVCYFKAIQWKDTHVKDDDSCEYGVEKVKEQVPQEESIPIAADEESTPEEESDIEN